MTIAIFIDIVTICLLAATILYARLLNKRILFIHENREEIHKLLEGFSNSLSQAEKSIQSLEETGRGALAILEKQLKEASVLQDDLNYLVKKGDDIANKLEHNVRSSRDKLSTPANVPVDSSVSAEIHSSDLTSEETLISEVKKKLIGKLKSVR